MSSNDRPEDHGQPKGRGKAALLSAFVAGVAVTLGGVALVEWQRSADDHAAEQAEASASLTNAQAEAQALADQRARDRQAHAIELRIRLDAEAAERTAAAEAESARLRAAREAAASHKREAEAAADDYSESHDAVVELWNDRIAGRRKGSIEWEDRHTVESLLVTARRQLDNARIAFEAAEASYSALSVEYWIHWPWQDWLDNQEAWLRGSERAVAELG